MLDSEKIKAIEQAEKRYQNISTFSPMMQHYIETKYEYKDCILCYRLGDFYEMFFEDAVICSRELELTLTGKDCGQEERAPMCGMPHHAVDGYISKLVEKGYKVAICEQVEDPKEAKGIVKREVIKVVTPGTIVDSVSLDEKKNNFIMSIYKESVFFGLAICDISTGDFYATEIKEDNNFSKLLDEIARYNPSEIITNEMMYLSKDEIKVIETRFNAYISKEETGFTDDLKNVTNMLDVVGTVSLENKTLAVYAINGLLNYIENTQKQIPENLNKVKVYETTKYMSLDVSARRNLELTERMRDKSKVGTLLWVLDKTDTSMGGRLLRRWISDPLIDVKEINNRLDAVEELKQSPILRDDVKESLKRVYDIERLAGKISYGTANARDLISLKNSILELPNVKNILSKTKSSMLNNLYNNLDTLDDIYELIERAIVDDPPLQITEGGIIKKGYIPELDELIDISTNGKKWLIDIETKEKELTGIKNLKIGYNKVFGYYLEVTKSFLKMVPQDRYIRKQTLTTGERYITEELKNKENEIVGAQEKIVKIEYEEFTKIRHFIEDNSKRLLNAANIVATLDCIQSFATVANEKNYCKPDVNNSDVIDIKEGRHPVIEKMLKAGEFIENDSYLDSKDNRLAIITGPNMAGKSTYMRQVALITLMAQIGSFVPATDAHIGVVDKIFTRVGASDDLAMGESTFMVEMMEVANILKNATENSLVILDEIGRGTSTYDGLSIAWAVAEYISKIKAKTLFATHYHELTKLENELDGIKNLHVAVKERGEDVIFLRKILEGGTDESYGIHVAKLAGVPQDVSKRANEILKNIERKSILKERENSKDKLVKEEDQGQLSMYNFKLAELAEKLDKMDTNNMTPIEALNALQKLKEIL